MVHEMIGAGIDGEERRAGSRQYAAGSRQQVTGRGERRRAGGKVKMQIGKCKWAADATEGSERHGELARCGGWW